MYEVISRIQKIGIVPVVQLNRSEDAQPLAKALCEGGLPCAEVTFRTEAAKESIRIMRQTYPDMLVGAGTVLTTKQVDEAKEAGAQFIVSPGFNPKIVRYCMECKVPVMPGCSSPSEVEQAMEMGLEAVKFFPAEAAGGLPMIKAMAAPYAKMKFMPTGGINLKNLNSYLKHPNIIACGGSFMVKEEFIRKGDFDTIKQLTADAVKCMLGFEVKRIGINAVNEEEAACTAESFETMFGFEQQQQQHCLFAGSGIEIMKAPYLGTHGHIAIATNYLDRAIEYLKREGYGFNQDSVEYGSNDELESIYLENEIGGYAVQIIQK